MVVDTKSKPVKLRNKLFYGLKLGDLSVLADYNRGWSPGRLLKQKNLLDSGSKLLS